MTWSGSPETTRLVMTGSEAGVLRSSTGAKVVFNPSRRTSCAMRLPCFSNSSGLPVAATAKGEGMGAIKSRSRSTVPPSTSMQRSSG